MKGVLEDGVVLGHGDGDGLIGVALCEHDVVVEQLTLAI